MPDIMAEVDQKDSYVSTEAQKDTDVGHETQMPGIAVDVDQKKSCVGDEAQSRLGVAIYPVEHGQIYTLLIDGNFMSGAEVQPAVSNASLLRTWR